MAKDVKQPDTSGDGSTFGLNSSFDIGVAFENGSAKGLVDLTNVDVVGDTLRIGSALFAEDQSDADGSLKMQGGSLQVNNASIGLGSVGTTLFANGLLETTDTTINISENLGVGFGPGTGTVKRQLVGKVIARLIREMVALVKNENETFIF